MFAQAKSILYIIITICCLSIGFGISEMARVKPLQAQLKIRDAKVLELTTYLSNTIEINKKNDIVCKESVNSRDKMITSLEKRIKIKTKACSDALDIITLHGGTNAQDSSNDDINNMLNGLYKGN